MSDYENAKDSSNYVNWGPKIKHKFAENITYPRRCYCGYPMRPGEIASYFLGHWTCPSCAKEVDERISWRSEGEK